MKKQFECNRDNLIIRGTEFRNKEGKLPAIILSHGFLANQKMCKAYAILAAELGYAAFTYDFNGGGIISKSSGKSIDMTVLTEVEDLKAVIGYVKQLPDVDATDITLLGCSQGGLVSALTAKEAGEEIKKLILLYPAFCIPDDARAGKMMFAQFDPDNIPPVIQKFPMKLNGKYAECVKNWQMRDMAGGYSGPVLYLHGTADKIVNIKYAREAVKEYSNVEYHEITDGEHVFKGKHEEEARKYISSFLSR